MYDFVAQTFDRFLQRGLINKLLKVLPREFVYILTSYVSDHTFRIKQEREYSEISSY